jgi:hypothetical protein
LAETRTPLGPAIGLLTLASEGNIPLGPTIDFGFWRLNIIFNYGTIFANIHLL